MTEYRVVWYRQQQHRAGPYFINITSPDAARDLIRAEKTGDKLYGELVDSRLESREVSEWTTVEASE